MSKEPKVTTKNEFYKRLCGIVIGIVVLLILNLLVSPDYLWAKWIAIFGILAIVVDFVNVFIIKDRFDD